jgi:hypothetical protein
MANTELSVLKDVAKAIKSLDQHRTTVSNYGTKTNANRADKARKNLVNIIFSNGYELEGGTYKVVKAKRKRPLV